MAVENAFAKAFGTTKAAAKNQEDKPKTQLWLNIGYTVVVEVDGEKVEKFVSLPVGLPLDTQEALKTNSQNQMWAQFQAARNGLLEQLVELGKTLQPGEEKLLACDESTGLSIQIRRVMDEQPAASVDNNVFAAKLKFA